MSAPGVPPSPLPPDEDTEAFRRLLAQVSRRLGFPGELYKEKCLLRRISVRMRVRGETTFAGYAALLERDPAEYAPLMDTLTVNVTRFFRDADVWQAVAERVVPALFDLPSGPPRAWSAGCSSGEEPFSLAILLREWAEAHGREADLARVRIVGTDIDRRSLAAASQGAYPPSSLTDVSPERLRRWFSAGPPFRLDPEIRAAVRFASRDLISGEAERGQSLILCRNVLIYLDRPTQEALFHRFHEALVPGGFLVLGRVEGVLGATRSLFRSISGRQRIYQKA